jgi:hypothetical protein
MRYRMRVLAIAAVLAAVRMASGTAGLDAAPAPGQISFLDGDVTIDGKAAVVGQAIRRGAAVRTGPASTCEITWGTQNIIQVQERTIAVIDVGALTPGIRLSAGSVAAVLNKVDAISSRGTFRVRTPSAVAGVRGTVFFVKVEDARNTYMCACFGKLAVTPTLAAEVDLASTNHTARRFTRAGLTTKVAPAGVLYHDSTSMGKLASRIGYTVPWGEGGEGSSGYAAGNGGYGN